MSTDMNLGTEFERNTISGSMEKLQFMKRRTKTGHVGFRFLFNVNACVCCCEIHVAVMSTLIGVLLLQFPLTQLRDVTQSTLHILYQGVSTGGLWPPGGPRRHCRGSAT